MRIIKQPSPEYPESGRLGFKLGVCPRESYVGFFICKVRILKPSATKVTKTVIFN